MRIIYYYGLGIAMVCYLAILQIVGYVKILRIPNGHPFDPFEIAFNMECIFIVR